MPRRRPSLPQGAGLPPHEAEVLVLWLQAMYTLLNFQLCIPTQGWVLVVKFTSPGYLQTLLCRKALGMVRRGRECGRGHRCWETTRLSWVPTLDRGQVCSKQHVEGGFAPSTSPEQPGPPPAMMSVVQRQGLHLVSLPELECPGRTPKMPLLAQEPSTQTGLHIESRPKAPTVIFQTLNLVTL